MGGAGPPTWQFHTEDTSSWRVMCVQGPVPEPLERQPTLHSVVWNNPWVSPCFTEQEFPYHPSIWSLLFVKEREETGKWADLFFGDGWLMWPGGRCDSRAPTLQGQEWGLCFFWGHTGYSGPVSEIQGPDSQSRSLEFTTVSNLALQQTEELLVILGGQQGPWMGGRSPDPKWIPSFLGLQIPQRCSGLSVTGNLLLSSTQHLVSWPSPALPLSFGNSFLPAFCPNSSKRPTLHFTHLEDGLMI